MTWSLALGLQSRDHCSMLGVLLDAVDTARVDIPVDERISCSPACRAMQLASICFPTEPQTLVSASYKS